MNHRLQPLIVVFTLLTFVVGLVLGALLWLLPQLHTLRKNIDNDRVSIAIIQQQQSNLTQLSKDIDSIRLQQTDLEKHIWLFDNEDEFFSALTTIATTNHVSLSTPSIADATPTGALINRASLVTFTGAPSSVLAAVTDIQHQSRLMNIQKFSLSPASSTDLVVAKITLQTLWK